jgi:alkylated DNA repair dioxygenase AlkB
VGVVTQAAETATLSREAWGAGLRRLAHRARAVVGDPAWAPNEATVMRYASRRDGITPHRDGSRFERAVFVVSLTGTARFDVVADRGGRDVLAEWTCRPGDAVVLRGPRLRGCEHLDEPRPLHRVHGPASGERVSLALRMDARLPASR